ncbi:MAG: carboxypeptidase-like regulatory domain-containing protein [Saprospiraceae bacterium]|nr:carboxypeptidase-like regulatory domain-containing protein [Saprospiraceae bacterium]
MRGLFLGLFMFFVFLATIAAQKKDVVPQPIQFSGKVVGPDENGEITPLPYTTIAVKGTSRGSVSDYDGFFSFVALKGETVIFSRIGFKNVEYTIPDTLSSTFYTWIQIMSEDNVWLDEVVIYPWPSREHFKHEFLAIDISNELREQAQVNLAKEVLSDMRYTVPVDGKEASTVYMRQQAEEFKYTGQFKPQRIFDVMAWKKFIEAWKRGDFKNKKKK